MLGAVGRDLVDIGTHASILKCITKYYNHAMRNVINISLPEQVAKSVRREVKQRGFASTSEFFRHLLRTHALAKELQGDRSRFERGEGKELRSFADIR